MSEFYRHAYTKSMACYGKTILTDDLIVCKRASECQLWVPQPRYSTLNCSSTNSAIVIKVLSVFLF